MTAAALVCLSSLNSQTAAAGFLPKVFSVGGKIYCYATFYCYANFFIVSNKFLGGQNSLRGDNLPPGACPLVEEDQCYKS